MRWPLRPVESNNSFRPAFCPWRSCPEHLRRNPAGYRFLRRGTYATRRRRAVPRFFCLSCRRSFSRQSFATSYYLKRPELLVPAAAGLVAGSAHRQISRSLGCAASTITRLAARLGRHGLLLLSRAVGHRAGRPCEPIVMDHFETFEFTQDYPFGVGMAVGSASWFVYAMDPAPHRRTGRRSAAQRRRLRRRPARALRGGYTASSWRLLQALSGLGEAGQPLQLIGDGHPAYRRAVRRLTSRRIRLESFPNPKRGTKGSPRSPQARRRDAAMFASDLLHGLLRHSMAHHRRETIAFGRRLNALMERFYVAAVWRNFIKGRSERRPDSSTPAMALGLTSEPWSWRRLLGRRLFPLRESLEPVCRQLYDREWRTPLVGRNATHHLQLAY